MYPAPRRSLDLSKIRTTVWNQQDVIFTRSECKAPRRKRAGALSTYVAALPKPMFGLCLGDFRRFVLVGGGNSIHLAFRWVVARAREY
jgi:hypothetical protein